MSRNSIRRHAALSLALLVVLAPGAFAADRAPKSAKPQATAPPAIDPAMAEMMKQAAPGAAHEKLRTMEGKWKAVQKSWSGPGEPAVTEGVSENRMILGGRFLEQHYQGSAMGQPFEGYGLTGYDNQKSEYVMFWVDNLSTSMTTGSGAMDAAGSELTMTSTGNGPDGKPTAFKLVTRMVDPNRHVFSMYATVDGKEQLMMEITYSRM